MELLKISLLCVLGLASLVYGQEGEEPLLSLQNYKPIYFLMGDPDEKIQVSFKIKVAEELGLYLGYTQLMMWELFKRPPSFRDLNYNPEIFYRIGLGDISEQWLDLGLFSHESNGKGPDAGGERSWNRTYLKFRSQFKIAERARVVWIFETWIPYLYNPNNRNILEYRGLYEVEVTLADILGTWLERSELSLRFYPGGSSYLNPFQGGQELSFRVKFPKVKFLPLFVLQVFHGYGENLVNYQDNRLGVRVGFGL